MKTPNILLIMADQLAPQFTGAYGHPLVQTPHMNALARRGMRFDAAYCNAPLCAPSRFSFMSGQLITRIAAYDNASEFPAAVPTFAHYLRTQGYQTCLAGKMHFVGPDQLHGFEERITTDIYPADYAWTPDWELPDERIDKWYHNMDSVREAGVAVTTFQLDYDEEVAFQTRRKILDIARGNAAPFCLVASFIHPHDPYVAHQRWWDLYDHSAITMPAQPFPPSDPFSQRLMDGIEASQVVPSEEEVRNARHAYFANTSYVDSHIGTLVQTLAETNLLDNTIVIVTADHGDMLGERGLWYKMNFFEHSARVPLIMAGPHVRHGTSSRVCSLVDILPTLLESTGAPQPDLGQPIDGRSLWSVATGASADEGVSGGEAIIGEAIRGEAMGEYCAEMTAHPVFMIRRGAYKYICCESDPPLLFNLESDPRELHNLVDAEPDVAKEFAREAEARWDSGAIRADVLAKQRQRRLVHAAMQAGALTSWDYNPLRDASQEYVRNHMDWAVQAEKTRFPPWQKQDR